MEAPNLRPESNIEYTNFTGSKDKYEKMGDFLLKGLSRSHKSQKISLGPKIKAERVKTNKVSSKRFSGILNVVSKPMTLMGRACMGHSKTYQEKVKVTEQSSQIAGEVLEFHAEKTKAGEIIDTESVEETKDAELAEAEDATLPNPNLQTTLNYLQTNKIGEEKAITFTQTVGKNPVVCVAWYSEKQDAVMLRTTTKLELQESTKTIEMKYVQGEDGTKISINGKIVDEVPDKYQETLVAAQDAIMSSIDKKSHADKVGHSIGVFNEVVVSNNVVIQDVKDRPDTVLRRLKTKLDKASTFGASRPALNLVVRFFDGNLEKEKGVDAGGLTRQFIGDLFGNLVGNSKDLKFEKEGGLSQPVSKSGTAVLSDEEVELYQGMGQLFMCCHNESAFANCVTGVIFDKNLFSVALMFSSDELDKGFDEVPILKKLELVEELLNGPLPKEIQGSIGLLEKIGNEGYESLTNKELEEIFVAIGGFDEEWGESCFDDDTYAYKHDGMRANQDEMMEGLTQKISDYTDSHLAPIHAVAQGMYSISEVGSQPKYSAASVRERVLAVGKNAMTMIGVRKPLNEEGTRAIQKQYWDETVTKLDVAEFSKKVQGSIDREEIASKIKFKTTAGLLPAQKRVLDQKRKWLQELVENKDGKGFDDDELKQFLQFTTGASSFDGSKINLYKTLGTPSPLPQAVTCYHMLLLCPKTTPKEGEKLADDSIEEFKKSLLYAFPETSFAKS